MMNLKFRAHLGKLSPELLFVTDYLLYIYITTACIRIQKKNAFSVAGGLFYIVCTAIKFDHESLLTIFVI